MRRVLALAAFAPLTALSAQMTDMPGMASKAEPVCVKAEIVPGFEGFAKPATGSAPAAGKAVALTLKAATAPPSGSARPFKPGTYQGRYALTIAKAGDYRIALSSGAWISVTGTAGEVESTAHGHGAACSGIAKLVTFPLKPGRYQIDLSEAKAPAIVLGVASGA
jgi:hypothetical protein